MKAFFLTGTDTEIGKTFSACALLHAWRAAGFLTAAYKPVAAGAECIEGCWSNEDARRLLAASSPGLTLTDINPVCLRSAVAPHIAAAEEGVSIDLPALTEGFGKLASRANRVLVEGVGGFRVPLGASFDSADLAAALGLPVLMVVGLRLGCINHALLTAEAISARGLTLAGWIANRPTGDSMSRETENIETLRQLIPAPCIGVLPHSRTAAAEETASALDIALL